jgi:hypothetical protein
MAMPYAFITLQLGEVVMIPQQSRVISHTFNVGGTNNYHYAERMIEWFVSALFLHMETKPNMHRIALLIRNRKSHVLRLVQKCLSNKRMGLKGIRILKISELEKW